MPRNRRPTERGRRAGGGDHFLDEPQPPEEDLVEWGETHVAVDFTPAGAPIGLTVAEHRRMNERYDRRKGWAVAKEVLRRGLADRLAGDDPDAIGWVRFLARGLFYDVYTADCRLEAGAGEEEEVPLVVRLPRADAPPGPADRALREAALLQRLSELDLPVRTPRVFAVVETDAGAAMIQEYLPGIPLEMRVSRCPGRRPWDVVAEAAAVCHGLDPAQFDDLQPALPRYRDRREHALARLSDLEALDGDEARAALEWCREHLPPPTAARFLHGDLLGQNVLRTFDESEPLAVIDWSEARLGDPAHDLAIVTRGTKKPFQSPRGLQRLLDAYNERSEETVTAPEVHLHELCLVAGFLHQEIEDHGPDAPRVAAERNRLRGVLRRAEEAG